MKVILFQELDTGFMAATLKPAFERLGHECISMQGWHSHLESNTFSVDYLLKNMGFNDTHTLIQEFKDTDLFILRAGDELMRDSGLLPYISKHNSVFRLHGHDLTVLGRPYALMTWRINWHKQEPQVVTYSDPTFLSHLKTIPIYIERPMDLSLIPRKKKVSEVFALSTPAGIDKKGGKKLIKTWKTKGIPLKLYSAIGRDEAIAVKAECSYFIDNVNEEYLAGPYGMNSVEAFLMEKPVFSQYTHASRAICPELSRLITHVTIDNVQSTIENFEPDRKALRYAKQYALRVHDPITIAKQYLALAEHIMESE